ncbi:serine/threonine-protein kinase pim-1-like [Hemibagrus wyckioides]|uniref:serine/threonine-protein kinase pim-1-like n=1 Tax=Hemibagrus wyckioides TaxID=337641 RepID=UPI00266C8F06|nr:serine/threonine-protein kinase pim-1-like [Hemibagrus wyckioides]
MREAMERTEVYEYLLSLTSGFSQEHFQELKCIHASKLAEVGLDAVALDYYEIITTTILSFPDRIQSTVVELLISLSEKLLQRMEAEEPKWLMKLRQLLPDNTDHCSPSDKQNGSGSKSERNLVFDSSVHSEFDSRYTVGELLGEGSYGSVYAGVRKADKLPVAIKVLARNPDDKLFTIPGETLKLPQEVALIKMASEAPRCESVVELLEWFKTSHNYILVLERPVPCMDLCHYIEHYKRLPEPVARKVMWQLVQAVDHCYKLGVFHRDIKLDNILINPDTLAIKLIDFGCGELVTNEPYRDFSGTQGYYPPEWVLQRQCLGVPHAVWSLGVVLYEIVCGESAFIDDEEIINRRLCFHSYMSDECWDLIQCCLQRDPDSRPDFSKILTHRWFKK